MDKTLRSILWILVGLVVLSSFSTGWFFVAKERLYTDYLSLENLFKTTVDGLNREIASVNKENTELKSKLEVVGRELSTLETRSKDLRSRYEALLGERDDLDRELARVKKGKFFLEKQLKDVESDMFVTRLLKEKASLEVELARLKDSDTPKDLEINRLKTENMDLDINLSRLKDENDFLAQKLKDSTDVAEVLTRDLLREKDKIAINKKDVDGAKIENRVLKARIEELGDVSAEFNRLFAEREDLRLKIAGLENELRYKDSEIGKWKTAFEDRKRDGEYRAEAYHAPGEVELPPIVLQSDDYGASARLTTPSLERIAKESTLEGGLRGRVVTVNRDHNFVVIDVGKQDGVGIMDSFKVYRGETLVGSIEVIQARERIAAADIIDAEEGFYIETNDVAIKR
ncbi:MAG: hypothetical protein KJ706_07730 [Candidatus Omnitrophica bacterium]|nr:hypothetical protein [Candidatus Omnitrophota bacterium]MBU4590691.1 hypothetical protein [Candidatus Omnitrophota bacterium]